MIDPLEQDNHAFEDRLIDAAEEPINYVEALRDWTKNNSCSLPIEEICETLEAYDELSKERSDLIAQIHALEKENSTLRDCIKEDIETEEMVKTEALKVLPPIKVHGDSYGVPSVAMIADDLVAHIQALEQERDLAIKEANRRDQKWIDGINETIGTKLDFHDPCARNNASKILGGLVARIKELERELAAVKESFTTQDRELFEAKRRQSEIREEKDRIITAVQKERDKARAEGAVMRETLSDCSTFPLGEDLHYKVCSVLDLHCGQDFLGLISEKNKWLRACLYSIEKHAIPFPSLEKLKACITDDTGHGVIKQAILDRDMEWWSALVLVDNVAPTPEAAKDWLLRLSEYERQPILEALKACVGALGPFECETCGGTKLFTFECQGCLTGAAECTCASQNPEPCPQCQRIDGIKALYEARDNALTKAKAVLR